jgi:hypothetical protein
MESFQIERMNMKVVDTLYLMKGSIAPEHVREVFSDLGRKVLRRLRCVQISNGLGGIAKGVDEQGGDHGQKEGDASRRVRRTYVTVLSPSWPSLVAVQLRLQRRRRPRHRTSYTLPPLSTHAASNPWDYLTAKAGAMTLEAMTRPLSRRRRRAAGNAPQVRPSLAMLSQQADGG